MNPRFLHKINSSRPVIVDFYADWCGPCKHVPQVLEEVKQEMRCIRVLKVNVDEHPFIAGHYRVRNLPTLMVFMNGEPVWTGEGLRSVRELKSILCRQIG